MTALFHRPARRGGRSLALAHFSPLGSRAYAVLRHDWRFFALLSGRLMVYVAVLRGRFVTTQLANFP